MLRWALVVVDVVVIYVIWRVKMKNKNKYVNIMRVARLMGAMGHGQSLSLRQLHYTGSVLLCD